MEHINGLPEIDHLHQAIGVSVKALAKLENSSSKVWKWFYVEGCFSLL